MDNEGFKVTKIESKRPVVRDGRIQFETEVKTFNNDQKEETDSSK